MRRRKDPHRQRTALGAILAALILNASAVTAEPRTYELPEETSVFRPGAGVEVAQENCLSCHSADYVTTQPPKLGEKFWEAVVSKMIKVHHAQISDSAAKSIVQYLSRTY